MKKKQISYRKDYREPDFLIPDTKIYFDIREDYVNVSSVMTLVFNGEGEPGETPLILNAEEMEILSVEIDDRALSGSDYTFSDDLLTLTGLADKSTVKTKVKIDPYNNTRLMGFYKSGNILCSQCEAQGFRRITPFLDHPDVLSRFTTTLEGTAPVLLSNGNLVSDKVNSEGRRVVTWQDPFPKPSYLFAAVAGDLGHIDDTFTTMSGRKVALQIYTDRGNESRAYHGMECLKMAMKWDEETYGLEYDLDLFMIVAVDAFNFGAMENKGLNIFNSAAVLADKDITTDEGLTRISGIVAHEYFHNWTGDRVTCRDWFQLTLKEGLTVFRDASYTSDTTSAGVARINQSIYLKQVQFPEDSGPNSHPIRPESYREIDNFYTPTVYRKGAEVIRMIDTLAGKKGFRQGMDEYFKRHDGQAVTCEDFLAAMEKGTGVDLTQFRRWYSQAGTPRITAETLWNPRGILTLKVSQNTAPTADKSPKKPFYLPLKTALFNRDGSLNREETLILSEKSQEFVFDGLTEEPVCSLLRDFSAPVYLDFEQSTEDLIFLLTHESDPYSRYSAVQTVYDKILRAEQAREGSGADHESALIQAFKTFLTQSGGDNHFRSLLLTLPSLDEIGNMMVLPDYTLAEKLREGLKGRIGRALETTLLPLYNKLNDGAPFVYNPTAVGNRALKGTLLSYLVCADKKYVPLAEELYYSSNNMTDSSAALRTLCAYSSQEKKKALAHYYDRWKDQFLPLTQWFTFQADSSGDEVYSDILALEKHKSFLKTNPNMIRALYGTFTQNLPQFHHPSGRGYRLIAERILVFDKINEGLSAKMAKAFIRYPQMSRELKNHMKGALESILAEPNISAGLSEVVENTLKSSQE
jgi:aminopeptidase N